MNLGIGLVTPPVGSVLFVGSAVGKVPVILAIGGREVEERTVTVRRLGEKQTKVAALAEITQELGVEATPPDLRG